MVLEYAEYGFGASPQLKGPGQGRENTLGRSQIINTFKAGSAITPETLTMFLLFVNVLLGIPAGGSARENDDAVYVDVHDVCPQDQASRKAGWEGD